MVAPDDIKDGLLLIRAVREGQVEQATAQLAAGVPLDVVDLDDRTALMWAASIGSETLVPMLLKAGADPNQANAHRRTALMYAASQDRYEVLPILMDAGADVNATESSGRNVLDFALQSANSRSARTNGRNKSWARLLQRVFALDMAHCPLGQRGTLRIIAVMTQGAVVRKILRHLQRAAAPPSLAPARARQAPCDWVA